MTKRERMPQGRTTDIYATGPNRLDAALQIPIPSIHKQYASPRLLAALWHTRNRICVRALWAIAFLIPAIALTVFLGWATWHFRRNNWGGGEGMLSAGFFLATVMSLYFWNFGIEIWASRSLDR